jgi:hypothetical protein
MSYNIYNNEGIGAITMASVLEHCQELSYSKAMLILPVLFHDESVTALKRSNAVLRSSEELMAKKVGLFGNFNARFYSLLPISINSLLILKDMGVIDIKEKMVSIRNNNQLDFSDQSLGKRAEGLIKASSRLAEILTSEDDQSLYLKFRIQL